MAKKCSFFHNHPIINSLTNKADGIVPQTMSLITLCHCQQTYGKQIDMKYFHGVQLISSNLALIATVWLVGENNYLITEIVGTYDNKV